MDLRIAGQILRNVNLETPYKAHSSAANEAEVESRFDEYLRDIGYGSVGGCFTKRTAKNPADQFPSKTGPDKGYPDYVFYESETSSRIIAVGDMKAPDPKGEDNSKKGLADCTDIYLKDYNARNPGREIRICFGYDGFHFAIRYLDASGHWTDITIDGEPLESLPSREMLLCIHRYGNEFTTQIQKNVSREALEPYFAQCDIIFRTGKSSLSAIDKAAEISIFIFLKIFSNDGRDREYREENSASVWENVQKGNVSIVNRVFRDFLNRQYENVFPAQLIKVDSRMTRDLARIIDEMFEKCHIDRMTDVKGNALEYYQKDSKDKKIGEFFTPRHLIELIIFLVNPQITFQKNDAGQYITDENGNRVIQSVERIYDPACGSGGFLITAFQTYLEKYGKYGVTNENLRENVIFGNELKDTTAMLTKLNMILLGDGHSRISNENALDILHGKPVNDKVREFHKEFFGKFDIVMANHPYALEEPKKPDELFVRHMIESVQEGGRIACIVGETLLFHRTYAAFRGWMLENITVEAIISLPQGVFNPYTDVKTSILLLAKKKPSKGHKTWLVDLQKDGFDLNLRRSPIPENDIPRVKRLWERWGGYEVEDSMGKAVARSYHREETGFAEFHKLDKSNWCVKRYNTPLMSVGTKYTLYPISSLLARVKDAVDIEDDRLYKQVTVQMHNQGIVLRTRQYGSEIGTKKQFVIKAGQFLISKIDARNGAYGIVPPELDGAVITGNFWTYAINRDIVLPDYLTYLMRHDFFLKMCSTCSYGATNRWYLDEATFNHFKVPVPAIEEQKKILEKIKQHAEKIEESKREIQKQEESIMSIIDEIILRF